MDVSSYLHILASTWYYWFCIQILAILICMWWHCTGLAWWLSGKQSACNAGVTGDTGLISGSRRSCGGGHGNPLQCSGLENPMDRGTWRAIVHRVAKSWTWLKRLSSSSSSSSRALQWSWTILCNIWEFLLKFLRKIVSPFNSIFWEYPRSLSHLNWFISLDCKVYEGQEWAQGFSMLANRGNNEFREFYHCSGR